MLCEELCWAAFPGDIAWLGGLYCEDCDVAPPDTGEVPSFFVGVRAYAVDGDAAARLWRLSAELTGIDRGARGSTFRQPACSTLRLFGGSARINDADEMDGSSQSAQALRSRMTICRS